MAFPKMPKDQMQLSEMGKKGIFCSQLNGLQVITNAHAVGRFHSHTDKDYENTKIVLLQHEESFFKFDKPWVKATISREQQNCLTTAFMAKLTEEQGENWSSNFIFLSQVKNYLALETDVASAN